MKFAPDTFSHGRTFEELTPHLVRDRAYVNCPISELLVNEAGQLVYNDDEMPMSQGAAETLAQKLRIPGSYIRSVSNEIASYNFNQFLPNAKGTVKLAIQDGVVAGVLSPEALPIPLDDLIEQLQEVEPRFDLGAWTLGSEGLMLRFTSERFTSEPKKGDIIQAGVDVWDHENTQGGLSIYASLLRLVCTNCAVSTDRTFSRKLRKETWRDPFSLIAAATGYFEEASALALGYTRGIQELTQDPLDLPDFDEERVELLRSPLRVIGLPSRVIESVSDAIQAENDDTLFGLYNAVTRLGRDAGSSSVRSQFEQAGYLLIERRAQFIEALQESRDSA